MPVTFLTYSYETREIFRIFVSEKNDRYVTFIT